MFIGFLFLFCFDCSVNSLGGFSQVMVLKLLKNTIKIIDRIMDWLANLIIFVVFCFGSSELLIGGYHLQLLVLPFICRFYTITTTTLQMFCLLNPQMNACEPNPKTTSSDFNRLESVTKIFCLHAISADICLLF